MELRNYTDENNVEDIIHKAKQRGRAISYTNGITKLITHFNNTDTIEWKQSSSEELKNSTKISPNYTDCIIELKIIDFKE